MSMLLLAAAAAAATSGVAPLSPQTRAELQAVASASARYRDFAVAEREGWGKFGGDAPLMGEHWSLAVEKGGVDYVAGQPLDLRRPSNLMYSWIGGKRVLTGVSFNVRLAPGEPIPQGFTGSADAWHVHDFRAAVEAATRERPLIRWVANGWMNKQWGSRARLAMVHVWTGAVPNPDGPFAHHNRAIPYAKLGLPLHFAEGASLAAARGLNLVADKGCAESIDGGLWIANAGGRKKALHAACQAAAAHVRPVLASGDKARINTMAEHAWAMFDGAWTRELTPEQRARIAAITEHGPSHPAEGHHHDH